MADAIVGVLDDLPQGYWYHRSKINSIPTQGDPTCSYHFLGNGQMPSGLRDALMDLAPVIPGTFLEEVCVNWYEPGEGMPEHIDLAQYRHNVVIALHELGDGVEVSGVFYPDVAGRAVCFPRKSEPHGVPPCKYKRYVLIYLYA